MLTGSDDLDPSPDDAQLAITLAGRAAQVLMDLRAEVDARGSDAGMTVGAAGDRASQRYLAAALAQARPNDLILSEESEDDRARLDADRVWIIDPLDGTREFAERSEDGRWRDDFAVHLALWQRGLGLTHAAFALPARDRIYMTCSAPALDDGGSEAVLTGRRPVRLAVSRTRPPSIATRIAYRADVELVPMGSAGAKTAAVIDGRVDAYVHAGGQYEWDSAAPVAVALAAGLVASRVDGSTLVYNQADPWSPDLVICRPELAAHLRAAMERTEASG